MDPHITAIFLDPLIGADALYLYPDGRALDVRIILSRQAEVWSGEAVIRQDTVSIMSCQVPNPSPGDEVAVHITDAIDREVWVLVNRLFDDGRETRWAVRRKAK